jgi:O-antigen ligase
MLRPERWALALLALSGAVILPEALNRFVFPKLAVAAAGVMLAATVPARGRLPRAAVVLVLAGSAVLVAGALTGATPGVQLIGRGPRYEGLLGLTVYLGAGVAGARLLGYSRARGSTAWFLRWLALASLVIGVEAVLEAAGLRPLVSNVARPGSLLGNASDEGAWAALALGPLAAVAIRVGGRLFAAGAVAALVTIACSGSRGALMGGIAVAMVLAVLAPRRGIRLALIAGLACLLIGAFALPATRARVTGSGGDATQTVTGRLLLWGETLHLLVDHPVLGSGPSGYVDAIPAYHTTEYERQVGPANPPDSPHNWLLQAAVAGGLPLLALALALVGLTLRRGLQAVREQPTGGEAAAIGGFLAGLVGYGVALLFTFTTPGSTPLAALFGGALLAGGCSPPPPGDWLAARWDRLHRPVRLTALGAAAGLTVLFAAAAAAEIPLRLAIEDAASGHLAAAQQQFGLARDLRPWDPEIAATAAHAYASLAADRIAPAVAPGIYWASRELSAYPHNIQALSDSATLELAAGRRDAARALLVRALQLEPHNPDLQRLLRTAQ